LISKVNKDTLVTQTRMDIYIREGSIRKVHFNYRRYLSAL